MRTALTTSPTWSGCVSRSSGMRLLTTPASASAVQPLVLDASACTSDSSASAIATACAPAAASGSSAAAPPPAADALVPAAAEAAEGPPAGAPTGRFIS
jgi:hypothetical protein